MLLSDFYPLAPSGSSASSYGTVWGVEHSIIYVPVLDDTRNDS